MIRIGIDVGGTNTDAVVMDGTDVRRRRQGGDDGRRHDRRRQRAESSPRTRRTSRRAPSTSVMIGTTHFTNAVVQRRDLAPTAAVRLGLPATASLPPMVDWPEDLKLAIGNHAWLAHGGNEFDGRTISPLDEAELLGIAAEIKAKGIDTDRHHLGLLAGQQRDREAGRRDLPQGAAGRAHHAVERDRPHRPARARERGDHECLPARSVGAGHRGVSAARSREAGIKGRFYLTQNDGTLMDASFAEAFPGADLCLGPDQLDARRGLPVRRLRRDRRRYRRHHDRRRRACSNGFPRQATVAVEVGGVRTNFRMPDVFSIGLGGGSHVVDTEKGIKIGPTSVGYRLTATR